MSTVTVEGWRMNQSSRLEVIIERRQNALSSETTFNLNTTIRDGPLYKILIFADVFFFDSLELME